MRRADSACLRKGRWCASSQSTHSSPSTGIPATEVPRAGIRRRHARHHRPVPDRHRPAHCTGPVAVGDLRGQHHRSFPARPAALRALPPRRRPRAAPGDPPRPGHRTPGLADHLLDLRRRNSWSADRPRARAGLYGRHRPGRPGRRGRGSGPGPPAGAHTRGGAMILAVALAGGAGAVARFVVDGVIARRSVLRLGTLLINVTGSFLLGLVVGMVHGAAAASVGGTVGTGLLGGYTTFSTASVESVSLAMRDGARSAVVAAGHAVVMVLACVGAA